MTELFLDTRTKLPFKRGTKYMGAKSPDEEYIKRGLYPIIDNGVNYNSSTQEMSFTYVIDEVAKTVTKTYTVVDIPAEEIFASKAKQVETAVQAMLDNSSRERGYDNIVSECSYATSTGAFGAEAQVTVNWRAGVWETLFNIQSDVVNKIIAEPTMEELLLMLPKRSEYV